MINKIIEKLNNSGKKIILASGSPRRKELLENAGLRFVILVTDADETVDESYHPPKAVLEISRRKAEAAVAFCIAGGERHAVIMAADTIVCTDGGEILNKPADKTEAFSMLKKLEGRIHSVYTGMTVAVIDGENIKYRQDYCKTNVKFKPLTDTQIKAYIETEKPYDKAGSYAIQGNGGRIVENIEGDYNNVVGLPVGQLLEMMELIENEI